jgi:nucleoside phosphorylase
MIAIVAAMSEELAPLVARIRARRAPSPSVGLFEARVAGRDVALAVTGDGARNARVGAAALIGRGGVDRLVVVGIAGAASEDLHPGALVVAEEVAAEAGASWRADPTSVEVAISRLGARASRVISARDIADTPTAKRRLAGGRAAVAVDLESATFVEAAVGAGVPWTVLRVISDGVDEALPPLLNRARDGGGAVRRGAVALGLLGQPAALPVLMRMRGRLRDAGGALADAVERLLRAA